MKNRIHISIVVLILLLSVGFAAVATTLIINGTTTIGFNQENFDVIFSDAYTLFSKSSYPSFTNATISNDKKEITWVSTKLNNIGESETLFYTVKNNSKDYDADLYTRVEIAEADKAYIDIEYTTFDPSSSDGVFLAALDSIDGTIKITLKKVPIEDREISIKLYIEGTPGVRDEVGEEPEKPCKGAECIKVADGDNNCSLTTGDEVTFGYGDSVTALDQEFYVVSSDENYVNLMTKYNLYVGGEYSCAEGDEVQSYLHDEETGEDYGYGWHCKLVKEITPADENYGIQVEGVRGYYANDRKYYIGTTPYSSHTFWRYYYSKPNNTYIYDMFKNNNPAGRFYVQEYVDYYVNWLREKYNIYTTGRLLRKDEFANLGCTWYDDGYWGCWGTQYSWMTDNSFWTGEGFSDNEIWVVSNTGLIANQPKEIFDTWGVRPVITLPKSYFQTEVCE